MARIVTVLGVLTLFAAAVTACKPNPADCFEKGEEEACRKICETGEEGSLMACYEIRARAVAACADGGGDCKAACELWANSESFEDIRNFYVGKLGTEARVAAFQKICAAQATP